MKPPNTEKKKKNTIGIVIHAMLSEISFLAKTSDKKNAKVIKYLETI